MSDAQRAATRKIDGCGHAESGADPARGEREQQRSRDDQVTTTPNGSTSFTSGIVSGPGNRPIARARMVPIRIRCR